MTFLEFDGEGITYKSMWNERSALNRFLDIQQVTVIFTFHNEKFALNNDIWRDLSERLIWQTDGKDGDD